MKRRTGSAHDFQDLIDRSTTALTSAMGKVNDTCPSWEELPDLLTDDELRAFLTFISRKWMR